MLKFYIAQWSGFCVFNSGHLIVVVFPSIKIYSLLILLFGHIRFPKICQNGVYHYVYECKSLLLNSLYTLPLHTIHQRSYRTPQSYFYGLFCPFLVTTVHLCPCQQFNVDILCHESSYARIRILLNSYTLRMEPVWDRWKLFANGKLFVNIKCCTR